MHHVVARSAIHQYLRSETRNAGINFIGPGATRNADGKIAVYIQERVAKSVGTQKDIVVSTISENLNRIYSIAGKNAWPPPAVTRPLILTM